MFCLNENNIYHLYTQGIDMRKGVEGLCGIIRTYQYSQSYQSRSLCLYEQITYSGKLAVISTLIQTCELLGINPKEWFSKTFSKIARQNNYNPETLLPYHYEENK